MAEERMRKGVREVREGLLWMISTSQSFLCRILNIRICGNECSLRRKSRPHPCLFKGRLDRAYRPQTI